MHRVTDAVCVTRTIGAGSWAGLDACRFGRLHIRLHRYADRLGAMHCQCHVAFQSHLLADFEVLHPRQGVDLDLRDMTSRRIAQPQLTPDVGHGLENAVFLALRLCGESVAYVRPMAVSFAVSALAGLARGANA